ncbi:hypothetical protein FYK55_17965 [Roseiconus nitratireducens]|uniref:Uncharacterized protein n=1 Tax=Roseiconus nitratireducens TaxID=2605748 RepID=A0A5M6D567_9BACT|nr:hypothetical protein [Roseiconus nitratireducens]KAA5541452.1 hypothetical protein FYK55_17965 [Roseiconus nitratireducens]
MSNPSSHPSFSTATSGNLTISNAAGPGGNDVLTFDGSIAAKVLANNNHAVTYSFSFFNPAATIDNQAVNPANIAALINGQSSIAFVNNQFNASGTISGVAAVQNTPEPRTTIALVGLVLSGAVIGYRRRKPGRQRLAGSQSST